jgi:hypothetical protein
MEIAVGNEVPYNYYNGNLISSPYSLGNLGEPYSIENWLLEKKAPRRNTCNKIGSFRFLLK